MPMAISGGTAYSERDLLSRQCVEKLEVEVWREEKENDGLKLFRGLFCRLGIKFNQPMGLQTEESNSGNFRDRNLLRVRKGILSLRAPQSRRGCL